MKKLKLLILFLVVVSFTGCKNHSDSSDDTDEVTTYTDEDGNEAYPDGTYCADIDYYNPDTGTRSTYTLNVEVESNEVTVIHWPNGGWLDDSHFSPEELDSSGSCSFTSDKGYEYSIQITGPECSYTDETKAQNDSEDDQTAITCPKCGGDKETYDELCWYCERKEKRKKEDIEEHTCKKCGQYDSFMFSTDELCSDCKRDEE
jgi:hypothetical protein